MGAVHIGICHNNNLVVAELGNIEVVVNSRSKRRDHGTNLSVCIDLVQSGFLHVQNLSSQRQDGLVCLASGFLGGSAGGISLYQVDLAVLRILVRTVCQLSRQSQAVQSGLSSGHLPGTSGSRPGSLGQNGFFADDFRNARVLLQEIGQLLAYHVQHSRPGLRIAKFLLGLALKLRLLQLHADNRSQALPDILSGKRRLVLL